MLNESNYYYKHYKKLYKKSVKVLRKYEGGGDMKAFQEALKEGLRVVVLAVIPLAIVGLQNNSLDFKTLSIVGLVALLRFVDSWLHESGQAEGGLTRF